MSSLTESESYYTDLDKMTVSELLHGINNEDQTVPIAVKKIIPDIEKLIHAVVEKIRSGGRLFYIGAGTSGRLGIVDASECPPTYGIPQGMVIGIIAGGDRAMRYPVENAEDSLYSGWEDLLSYQINEKDLVIGIAASGTTPYVVGALDHCRTHGIMTACITCNPGSPVTRVADFPIEVAVGPEFVTGSTRMKGGTAQKLVLNMISTTAMIQLGKIKGNKMVDMQLTNHKLIQRGTDIIAEQTGLSTDAAREWLLLHGSVRKAIESFNKKT